MRKLTAALLAVLALTLVNRPVQAEGGGMFFGTHLGIAHFIPEDGDGLTAVTWPSQGGMILPIFQPGMRVGGFLDAERRQALYLDTGLSYFSSDGQSFKNFQAMAGYEHVFSAANTAPFVDVGLGMLFIGDEDESYNSLVFGGGVGLRHMLAHGHGALRAEVHLDRQLEDEEDGDVRLPAFTSVGLRLGFDLYLK